MDFFRFELCVEYFPKIIRYLPTTMKIAAISAAAGILIGLILAVVRIYRIPVLEQLAIVLTSFLRATPPNVLLLMIFFAIPFLFQDLCMTLFHFNINRMDLFVYVAVAYSIMNSAFFAEMFRGAVSGVEKGQMEAATALGLTRTQAFIHVILPQTAKLILPAIGNEFISMLKDSSLVSQLALADILRKGREYISRTFLSLETMLVVALIYLIFTLVLSRLVGLLEERLHKNG